MKANTILNRIKESEKCSISDIKKLTNALHREGKLSVDYAIRFMCLVGKFDIVNADYETNDLKYELHSPMDFDLLYNKFMKSNI